jgi:hypothetical protein
VGRRGLVVNASGSTAYPADILLSRGSRQLYYASVTDSRVLIEQWVNVIVMTSPNRTVTVEYWLRPDVGVNVN